MSNQGLESYHLFNKVIFLDEVVRQQWEEANENDIDYINKKNQKDFCKMLKDTNTVDTVGLTDIHDVTTNKVRLEETMQKIRDKIQKKLPKQKKVYGDMSSLLLTVEDNDDVFVEPIKVLKPKSKRDELLEGLNYLKSKKIKTVKDKESIYTLELLLKS
jgi:hypothetical protein